MMKRIMLSLMMLCAVMMAQAQTIRENQKFWDGYSLYTVKEIRNPMETRYGRWS